MNKVEAIEATTEKIRPIFFICPRCEGVGFIMFDSIGFIGFDEPTGLIKIKCEICDGIGEISQPTPVTE